MQIQLAPAYQDTPQGQQAQAIVRQCVHCGFCTATCPTYQLLGDELDSPRGRIYLIKQVLEGNTPTRKTQQHLDRCLTCRNCETTCPSGVEYGHLLDIGRELVDAQVPRPTGEKMVRWALRHGLSSPLFAPAMRLGQAVRGVLPAALQAKVPAQQDAGAWPVREHARKMLLLAGCVQPSMSPNTNAATARVLDAVGVQVVVASNVRCCGAVKMHLSDHDGALTQMRANIDAWWPWVEPAQGQPVEALVMNASGCGVTVKEYGHYLQHDPAYAAKAARISALTRDVSELLPDWVDVLKPRVQAPKATLAYHPPCTLQHGQRLRGGVEQHLAALGFTLRTAGTQAHLCCGSAGTYSVLQPELSYQLRDRKLQALCDGDSNGPAQPQAVISGNIGCVTHLQSGTPLPVMHWIEALDAALQPVPALL